MRNLVLVRCFLVSESTWIGWNLNAKKKRRIVIQATFNTLAGSTVASHGSLGKNNELVNSQMEMADAFIENVNFVKDNALKKMKELRKELENDVEN